MFYAKYADDISGPAQRGIKHCADAVRPQIGFSILPRPLIVECIYGVYDAACLERNEVRRIVGAAQGQVPAVRLFFAVEKIKKLQRRSILAQQPHTDSSYIQ